MKKWIGLSLGAVLGIGHIGMIGMLANRESKLPSVDIPVGDYTSYKVSVSEDGYAISYKANDPKTAFITKDIKEKGGFLGLANETTVITEEYFMDGKTNQGGAVSNHRSWLSGNPGLTQEEAANITAIRKSEECIKSEVNNNEVCIIYPMAIFENQITLGIGISNSRIALVHINGIITDLVSFL